MRVNPEELVELTNHGSMKLRCAVARAMLLLPTERRKATIVRHSEPSVLKFRTIKDLSNVLERSRESDSRELEATTTPRAASNRSMSNSLSRSQGRKSPSRPSIAKPVRNRQRQNPATSRRNRQTG